ncbi:MAG: hypothetical protein AB7O56_09395 [Bauldia sp.]
MSRALKILAGGVLGAIVVHILVVMLLPRYGGRDVWTVMSAYGPEGAFHLLPRPETGGVEFAFLDPHLVHAVCRFELDGEPLRIRADVATDFWSAALFDRSGNSLYSLNDRTAGRADVDLFLIGPAEVDFLPDAEANLPETVIVDLPIETGLVVIRAFFRDAAMKPLVEASLAGAACDAPLDLPPPPPGDRLIPSGAAPGF